MIKKIKRTLKPGPKKGRPSPDIKEDTYNKSKEWIEMIGRGLHTRSAISLIVSSESTLVNILTMWQREFDIQDQHKIDSVVSILCV